MWDRNKQAFCVVMLSCLNNMFAQKLCNIIMINARLHDKFYGIKMCNHWWFAEWFVSYLSSCHQRLQNYIHQHWPITAFWLVFSTFLYKKNCLEIGHEVTNVGKSWCAGLVSQTACHYHSDVSSYQLPHCLLCCGMWYRKTSSISRTKSPNLNVSCILLQLSSLNPLKAGVKLGMKM